MSERFTVRRFEFFSQDTRLRFPFRYGIASMTEVPQQFVRVWIDHDGRQAEGLACEGLPPKWFTKNPETPFETDLAEMREVIQHAANAALSAATQPIAYFDFWRELTRQQDAWAAARRIPPLLAHLGVSLVERAVLDALCRSFKRPFHALLRGSSIQIPLGEIYPELGNATPADLLPSTPRNSVQVRHTIGLADPLTPADIPAAERVDDGLPQDLESSIRFYGLNYFKIKLSGDAARDVARLEAIRSVCDRLAGDWRATMDGNENFKDFGAFRDFWEKLISQPRLRGVESHTLLIEQPVHRNHALDEAAAGVLRQWSGRPPLIIDESDGAVGDVPRALELGYDGASHKNCKGIVKGIANACLLAQRRASGRSGLLTGEDLCNLGPVPLLQDLAMMALLGVEHVERNGHHYYRGLSMWPHDWQKAVQTTHPDLYEWHSEGFARLRVSSGQLPLDSVNEAPFGCAPLLQQADR